MITKRSDHLKESEPKKLAEDNEPVDENRHSYKIESNKGQKLT